VCVCVCVCLIAAPKLRDEGPHLLQHITYSERMVHDVKMLTPATHAPAHALKI
jgi:hypothetical protein